MTINQETEYPDDPQWPYVKGFSNAPEVKDPIECKVTGKMPSWLSGALYRAGPGIFDMEIGKGTSKERVVSFDHWFDGVSLLHRFEIKSDGTVQYRNRFISKYMSAYDKSGDKGFTFGSVLDPCETFFGKIFTRFRGGARPNVNVTVSHNMNAGNLAKDDTGVLKTVIKTDANVLMQVDDVTLEPGRMFTYTTINPELKGYLSAAHEEYDPETGSFFNFVLNPGLSNTYTVFELSPKFPSGRIIGQWTDPNIRYIHSFASTKKYIIFIQWGCLMDPKTLFLHREFVYSMSFDDKNPTKFIVMDREQAKIVGIYESDPFFCFHTVNAFDDDATGDIVIDLAGYPDLGIIQSFSLGALRNVHQTELTKKDYSTALLHRFRLKNVQELSTSSSSTSTDPQRQNLRAELEFKLEDAFLELPVINPTFRHKSHQFIYGISEAHPKQRRHAFTDSLIKIDVETKTFKHWSKKGHTPGEPIFVAAPNATAEDDGVLLSVVLDGTLSQSYLLVLDAKTLKEVCTAGVPHVVSYGFHGSFLSS